MVTPTNYKFKRISNKIVDEAKASSSASFLLRKNSLIEDLIKARIKTPADLAFLKRKISKKYKIPCPSNIKLLKAYHELVKKKSIKKSEILENLLKTRPIRSLSGIVNISVLTKPYPCPGKCLYCPLEKGIPKSYVSGEPAVERAKKLNYDPYLQVKKRTEMLENQGHPTDKIELRIIGGTWSYYPKQYRNWFIKRCFEACNKNSKFKSQKLKVEASARGKKNKYSSTIQLKTKNFYELQKKNEGAKHRIVGLSIETRPDFINKKEIEHLRELGVTMVELGVQSIYDEVLKLNLRGHGVKEIISATKLLKDAGFKVLYQIMLNLPGSNLKKDEKMLKELFSNPNFQPDLLKIYPCALLKEAPLYNWWKKRKYKPYTELQLINLLKKIKKLIPYYVRIQRIARDIPSEKVITGAAKVSNLRQILAEISKKEGWKCRCIRCREVKEDYNPKEKVYLFRKDYNASDGKPQRKISGFLRGREIFLSFETKNRKKLYSLLRLRIILPQLSLLHNAAIIREIQTFGKAVPIGIKKIAPQHKGLGKKLIKEAERIVKKEFGLNKIAVISGIGVRGYWRKLGYKLRDTYMIKNI